MSTETIRDAFENEVQMENIIASMFTLRRKLSQIMPNWQQYLIQTINYDKVFLKLLLLGLRTSKLKNIGSSVQGGAI